MLAFCFNTLALPIRHIIASAKYVSAQDRILNYPTVFCPTLKYQFMSMGRATDTEKVV